jgi:hypothetical protein
MQRECLFFHEHLPHCNEIRIIDGEHVNCDAAHGGFSDEFCSCPREMVAPSVLAWVEKPDEFAGDCMVSGDVRTLMPVTVQASQGKIVDGSGTSMLARDDVIDVKRQGIDGRR